MNAGDWRFGAGWRHGETSLPQDLDDQERQLLEPLLPSTKPYAMNCAVFRSIQRSCGAHPGSDFNRPHSCGTRRQPIAKPGLTVVRVRVEKLLGNSLLEIECLRLPLKPQHRQPLPSECHGIQVCVGKLLRKHPNLAHREQGGHMVRAVVIRRRIDIALGKPGANGVPSLGIRNLDTHGNGSTPHPKGV